MVGRVGCGGTHVDVENSCLGIVDGDLERTGFNRVEDLIEDVRYRVVAIKEVIMFGDEAADFARDLKVVFDDMCDDGFIFGVCFKGKAAQGHDKGGNERLSGRNEEGDTRGVPANPTDENLLLPLGDAGDEEGVEGSGVGPSVVDIARDTNDHLRAVEQGTKGGFDLVSLWDNVRPNFTVRDEREHRIAFIAGPSLLARFVDVCEEAPSRDAIWESVGIPDRKRGELDAGWSVICEVKREIIPGAVS